jgi:endoglycosylceramidase
MRSPPILLALLCSCAPPIPAEEELPPAPVRVVGRTFQDLRGRQLIFRGYNAKVAGIFDVTFDDGRLPMYSFRSFDAVDAARFEEYGFNALRLPISWSALEPEPKQYSEAFLLKLDAVLELAKQHGFQVLLDMHQDAYSKEIGEDGAPLWAIVPPPEQRTGGPIDESRRLTKQALNAGFNFFANRKARDGRLLQEAFVGRCSRSSAAFRATPRCSASRRSMSRS